MKLFKKDKDSEKAIVSRIQAMYKEAYDSKSNLHDKWKENYKAYTGELFKKNISSDRSNAVINHIFSTIETIKPIMLSNYPKSIVLPKREMHFEKAIRVQNALDYEYKRTRFFNKLSEALTQGLIYGNFIIGLFWNGEASNGAGEIEPVLISPFNFFLDPMATSIDNAQYVMYATYKNVGEVIKSYPDKAEELKNDSTNNIDENLVYGKESNSGSKNQVLYIEAYFRDYAVDTEVEEEKDDEGNPTGKKYKVTKMKYPNGRRVIIAGNTLLDDGENPYDDGRFPFVSWKCYPVPNTFWGISEVELLISPQKHMIDLIDNVIENANLCGNPIWIVDKNSGIEKNSLTNRKGLVVRKNPGTEARREPPPPMPAYIQNMIADLKSDIQVISGVFDATRGERPASITSGVAITSLQEQSQSRIKLKVQNMEFVLSELFGLWLRRIQQFWVMPRIIRIFGMEYTPNSQETGNGMYMSFDSVGKDELDGDFDIEILTGSTMAVNRSVRLEQLIRLGQTMAEDGLPIVDRRTILEYTELDNVDDIIKRFEAEKEAQKQAQMEAQAMQQEQVIEQQDNSGQLDMLNTMMKSQLDSEANNQNALQSNGSNIQSNIEGEEDIIALVELISKMSPEEIKTLLEERPEVQEIINMIIEQPNMDSIGGM